MEKRVFDRKELNLPIQMKFMDVEILCNIENMSEGGALAQINPTFNKYISENSIGEAITFTVGFGILSERNFKGYIARYEQDGDLKYIAISFV